MPETDSGWDLTALSRFSGWSAHQTLTVFRRLYSSRVRLSYGRLPYSVTYLLQCLLAGKSLGHLWSQEWTAEKDVVALPEVGLLE
jgi:hypothetical protein